MPATKVFVVHANWDDEANVWVATSEDVPGLVTESPDINALVSKLKILIPELLDANGFPDGDEVPFILNSHLQTVAYRHTA